MQSDIWLHRMKGKDFPKHVALLNQNATSTEMPTYYGMFPWKTAKE